MLHLILSNRFEILLAALLERLAQEAPGAFVARQVIVPSAAIARRIELALADRDGVCANVEFSYLAQWLWRQIAHVVPVAAESPFAPEVLAWRVYEALGDPAFTAAQPRLAAHVAGTDALMRFELAGKIAGLLEQYITYRPEFPAAWSSGRRAPVPVPDAGGAPDEAWQGALWRRIAAEVGAADEHPASTFFRRIEALGEEAPRIAGLPRSAHVFCLPGMPPLYLDMLRQLARWIELRVYAINPCEEYWFDVIDPGRLHWLAARGRDAHHESGNRLLASWGRQTQAHIDLLLSGEGELEESACAFAPAPGATLLARLQNAILALEEPAPGAIALEKDDRSIEVHVCHSLTREIEVLHDQLLALFAGPQPPRPSDILVVTPDLAGAAPLIDAVFGAAPDARRIPYAISGQPQRKVNPVARALDALIALTAGRHPASAVFDLLLEEPVAARFGLDAEALDSIRAWIAQAGIRWALDEEQREALELPPTRDHTFRDGLERLYLAYALGDSGTCLDGRAGAGNPEGQSALALGGFWRFVQELRALRRDWRRPKDADGWRAALDAAMDRFIAPSAGRAEDERAVRAALAELHEHMTRGGLRGPVPLEILRAALGERLDDRARGGVPTGRVTFSSLGSLRSVPYRIVCAIGMNDGVFPTAAPPLEFDLMALAPRRGDRQRRLDERNLFLDLLLAARERLYISYTGRSVRDNSRRPPSVLVAELLDYAVHACSPDAAGAAALRKRLVVEHPLQPFSPDYFSAAPPDPRLRSFDAEACAALREKLAHRPAPEPLLPVEEDEGEGMAPDIGLPFFTAPLGAPPADARTVRLEQLAQFFLNPCRALLRHRLGIARPAREEALADDEPFLPDWPGRQALAARLLDGALAGADEEALLARARAGNEYPPGPLGAAALEAEVHLLHEFAQRLRSDLAAPLVPPHAAALAFPIEGEEWRLEGALGALRASGLVRWRYDDARVGDYLSGWIAHLFFCATHAGGSGCTTRWHSRDGVYALGPCPEAPERLAELLALYREGLQRPLPFFPRSAWEFMASEGSLAKARGKWTHWNSPAFGESSDPAYRLALRGVEDPLDERFAVLARQVLAPLLGHLSDPRP